MEYMEDDGYDDRERFDALLRDTGREGIDGFLDRLGGTDFYVAPASSRYHGAFEGGLLAHSLAVFDQAEALRAVQIELRPETEDKLPWGSVAICALLHDACKIGRYRRVERSRRNAQGVSERYEAYESDFSRMPYGHGEGSVLTLMRLGLELTDDEALAIRWHMGAWDLSRYKDSISSFNAAQDRTPLLPVLIAADALAVRVTEDR